MSGSPAHRHPQSDDDDPYSSRWGPTLELLGLILACIIIAGMMYFALTTYLDVSNAAAEIA